MSAVTFGDCVTQAWTLVAIRPLPLEPPRVSGLPDLVGVASDGAVFLPVLPMERHLPTPLARDRIVGLCSALRSGRRAQLNAKFFSPILYGRTRLTKCVGDLLLRCARSVHRLHFFSHVVGAPGAIRTPNTQSLNLVSLPIGLQGLLVGAPGIEPRPIQL